jgi:hypothetical protein
MYERTTVANDRLSDWNAQAVLVPKDKSENPDPNAGCRITFNYQNVVEDLPGCYLELMSECHDYLAHPRHKRFMTFDLKQGYYAVPIHPPHRHHFAFTISGIRQL